MNRRNFFKGMAAVAAFVAIPVRICREYFNYDEIVHTTLVNRMPDIIKNATRENQMIAQLLRRVENTEADIQRQLDEHLYGGSDANL